jgi:hypothetical protein
VPVPRLLLFGLGPFGRGEALGGRDCAERSWAGQAAPARLFVLGRDAALGESCMARAHADKVPLPLPLPHPCRQPTTQSPLTHQPHTSTPQLGESHTPARSPLGSLPPPHADLAVILAMDWLLDRIRTTVNLLSDAYGCLIVDHLLQRSKWRERGGGGDELSAGGGGGSEGALGGFQAEAEEGRGGGGAGLERGLPHGAAQQVGPSSGHGKLLGTRKGPGYVQLEDMRGRE